MCNRDDTTHPIVITVAPTRINPPPRINPTKLAATDVIPSAISEAFNKIVAPKCRQPGCVEQVKYSFKLKKYYEICHKCTCQNPFCSNVGRNDLSGFCGNPCTRCIANGCNRVAHAKFGSEWCAKCYTRYEKNGEVRCTTCPDYTTNQDAICDTCLVKGSNCPGNCVKLIITPPKKKENATPKSQGEWYEDSDNEGDSHEGDYESYDASSGGYDAEVELALRIEQEAINGKCTQFPGRDSPRLTEKFF